MNWSFSQMAGQHCKFNGVVPIPDDFKEGMPKNMRIYMMVYKC